MQHKMLYAALFSGFVLLVLASLGNGLTGSPLDYSDWQYRIFRGVCHQMPGRSLHVNGVPMAVNARCFGIFSGVLAGWLLIPVLAMKLYRKRGAKVLLAGTFLLLVADYSAGLFCVWNSSNFSRFFLGTVFGAAVSGVMADLFMKTSNIKT